MDDTKIVYIVLHAIFLVLMLFINDTNKKITAGVLAVIFQNLALNS